MKRLISCLLVVLMFWGFIQMCTLPVNSYAAEDSYSPVEAKNTQSDGEDYAIKRVKLSHSELYNELYSYIGDEADFIHLPVWGISEEEINPELYYGKVTDVFYTGDLYVNEGKIYTTGCWHYCFTDTPENYPVSDNNEDFCITPLYNLTDVSDWYDDSYLFNNCLLERNWKAIASILNMGDGSLQWYIARQRAVYDFANVYEDCIKGETPGTSQQSDVVGNPEAWGFKDAEVLSMYDQIYYALGQNNLYVKGLVTVTNILNSVSSVLEALMYDGYGVQSDFDFYNFLELPIQKETEQILRQQSRYTNSIMSYTNSYDKSKIIAVNSPEGFSVNIFKNSDNLLNLLLQRSNYSVCGKGYVSKYGITGRPAIQFNVDTYTDVYGVPICTLKQIKTEEDFSAIKDIDPNRYYYRPIKMCYLLGLIHGTTNTKISPNDYMNRAMFVTILWRLNGAPEVENTHVFKDVSNNNYYTTAVYWAYSCGLTSGTSPTTFSPKSRLTREQAVVFLYRLHNNFGYGFGKPNGANINDFKDVSTVSPWAYKAMSEAIANGVIAGKRIDGELHIDPRSAITRAECVTLLYRLLELNKIQWFCEFLNGDDIS